MTAPDPRTRLDRALVERGLFSSRAQAQAAISAGCVKVDGHVIGDAARKVGATTLIEAVAPHPWVSRGGVKLAAALDHFGIDPSGALCLDIGASTGGFTEVLLSRGARQVVAVDVGRDQFHARLRSDGRVILMEAFDARMLSARDLPTPPSLIVADVSFISLTKALPIALDLAAAKATAIALIKPQFEVGRAGVSRGGIVRDPASRASAVDAVTAWFESLGWRPRGVIPSPITGGDGNEEFLLAADRS